MQKKKKSLVYVLVAVLSLGFMFQIATNKNDYNFLETSFLHILKKIAEENKPAPPDLMIKNVTLKKVSDPKDYFNYFKYEADIEIVNLASNLKDAKVVIRSGDSTEFSLGSNFSLAKNESFIVEDYEVLFDGDYNSGEVKIEVVRTDKDEYYTENNTYLAPVFELPARIETTALQLLKGDYGDDVEIMKGEFVSARNYEYREIIIGDEIISFHEIKNSSASVDSDLWESVESYSGEPAYIYLKKTDKETGNYAVSKIWKFFENKKLTRAEFAKMFVDYANVDLLEGGVEFFEDVDYGADYAPYVHTLYNLGLIETDGVFYFPEAPATRADVLQVVMNYFDIDLYTKNNSEYSDPYLQTLNNSELGKDFSNPFEPEEIASEAYLKHLINAYQ